jgi:hypothetical protein
VYHRSRELVDHCVYVSQLFAFATFQSACSSSRRVCVCARSCVRACSRCSSLANFSCALGVLGAYLVIAGGVGAKNWYQELSCSGLDGGRRAGS